MNDIVFDAANNTTTTVVYGPVESIIFKMWTAIAITLLVVVIRIILARFITALMNRGRISAGTKSTLIRLIDVISIFIILVAFLELVVTAYMLVVTVALLIIASIILFFYELREFLAYINLQLLRHIHGRTYEFKLPHHDKPVYGRIISIEPLNSTIEDIYGRRIYVSNTLLVNSIMTEYIPSIQLLIKLSHAEGDPMTVVNDVIDSIKRLELSVFRIDEKKIVIRRIGGGEVSIIIRAFPTSLPVRLSDLLRLVEKINKSLAKYNPVIQFLEQY